MQAQRGGLLSPVEAPGQTPVKSPAVLRRPTERGPRPGWPILLGVVLVGLAAAWFARQTKAPLRPRTVAAPVRVAKVRSGTLERILRIAGVTTADKFAMLMAPRMRGSRGHGAFDFNLTLQYIAKGGARVRRGDPVAEFDTQYMQLRLEDYRSMVIQHEANLRKLRSLLDRKRESHTQMIRTQKGALDKAELELRRTPVLSAIKAENLLLQRNEAQAHYDEVLKQVPYVDASELAAVRRSEADLRVNQLEFRRAERNLERMAPKAPMDGMVVLNTIRRGSDTAQIESGDQIRAGQIYMRIVDLESIAIEASANQVDTELLRAGLQAHVHFDAYPGLELPARVVAVGTYARSTGWRGNYVRTIPIRLKLNDADPRVIPDLTVSADLTLNRLPDAIIVPREAVFYSEAGQPFVVVQNQDGWEKRPIEVKVANNIEVAIKDGVKPGETLAAEWQPDLLQGQ